MNMVQLRVAGHLGGLVTTGLAKLTPAKARWSPQFAARGCLKDANPVRPARSERGSCFCAAMVAAKPHGDMKLCDAPRLSSQRSAPFFLSAHAAAARPRQRLRPRTVPHQRREPPQ